jgi:glycosyltransferase involved in cell wall biosynthesis
MSERVTWLMAVKNGMPYLPETLASIEAQTYRDWEVLVWDNGSNDGTVEELQRWIPDRLPGRVIAGQPLSLSESLAALVRECQTELAARIDADDINLPERLERQVAYLQAHPEIAVVGSQVTRIDSEGVAHGQHDNLPLSHADIVWRLFYAHAHWHPTVLFRRSAILDIGNYQAERPVEDFDLWLRMATRFKQANLPESLLNYRVHDNNVTMTFARAGQLHDKILEVFSKNAPHLYGCSAEEAQRLRLKEHPRAFFALYRITRYLKATQGVSVWRQLRSIQFHEAAARTVQENDYLSLLFLTILDTRGRTFLRKTVDAGKILLKMLGLKRLRKR